ncbi:DsbA family protein, partial [bacterium]|nr:DsbA family protein [bacterium]
IFIFLVMKEIFVLLFLILSANLIAEEPQTQTQGTPGLTIQTNDSKHFYIEEDFPSGTFEGLSDDQKKEALEALNSNMCTCGCSNDTIATCRIKDPNCGVAPELITQVLNLVREGKNAKDVGAELKKSELEDDESDNLDIPEQHETAFVAFRKDDPYQGPLYAKVTIVGFSEFQCPYCRMVLPTLEEIKKIYGDSVKIVWKHRPLSFHSNAFPAAEAAEAAREQGKFWEMHDLLFQNQTNLSSSKFEALATTLGLDMEKFKVSIAAHRNKSRIEEDSNLASSAGATGTPTFFINGKKLVGALPLAAFKNIINEELNRANQIIEKGIELDADFYQKIVKENEKMVSEPLSN